MIKLNKNFLLAALLLCGIVGFAGCSTTAPNSSNNVVVTNTNKSNTTTTTSNTANTTANTTTAPANTANTTTTTTTTTGDKTGVAECDEYIEKYEACLTKIAAKNPQVEPSLKTAFEQQRKAFKDAASTPEGKTALAPRCKQAIDTAKASTSSYGCAW